MPHKLSPKILAMLLDDSEALTEALTCMADNAKQKIDNYKKALLTFHKPKITIDQLFLPWMKKNSGCGAEEREIVLSAIREIEQKYPDKNRDSLLKSLHEWNVENDHDPNSQYEVYEIPADPINDFIHYYASLQYPLGTIVEETNTEDVQSGLIATQALLWSIQKEQALIDNFLPSVFYHLTEEQQQQVYRLIEQTIEDSQSQTELQSKIAQLAETATHESSSAPILIQTAVSYLKDLYLAGGNNNDHESESDEDLEEDSDS